MWAFLAACLLASDGILAMKIPEAETEGSALLQRAATRSRIHTGDEPDGDESLVGIGHLVIKNANNETVAQVMRVVKSTVGKGCSQDEQDRFVRSLNIFRCRHGAPAVKWNKDVADSANEYVSPLTKMKHSKSYEVEPPAGPAGENIYWSSKTGSSPEDVMQAWYDEVNDCRKGPEKFEDGCKTGVYDSAKKQNKATGHFTAMIWKGVKEIGCAYSNDNHMVLCRFKANNQADSDTPNMNPESNYIKQVIPRKRSEQECIDENGDMPPMSGDDDVTDGEKKEEEEQKSGQCVTRQGCKYISKSCGGQVKFEFKCGQYLFTGIFPDNFSYDLTAGCGNQCGDPKVTSISA